MYLAEDEMRDFSECSRCGERGLEKFKTHMYCVSCNYSERRSQSYFNQDQTF